MEKACLRRCRSSLVLKSATGGCAFSTLLQTKKEVLWTQGAYCSIMQRDLPSTPGCTTRGSKVSALPLLQHQRHGKPFFGHVLSLRVQDKQCWSRNVTTPFPLLFTVQGRSAYSNNLEQLLILQQRCGGYGPRHAPAGKHHDGPRGNEDRVGSVLSSRHLEAKVIACYISPPD